MSVKWLKGKLRLAAAQQMNFALLCLITLSLGTFIDAPKAHGRIDAPKAHANAVAPRSKKTDKSSASTAASASSSGQSTRRPTTRPSVDAPAESRARTSPQSPVESTPLRAPKTKSVFSNETLSYKIQPSLSYSLRTDLADQRDPRINTHRLGATLSTTILNHAGSSAAEKKTDDDDDEDDEDDGTEIVTLTASIAGQARTIGQDLDGQQGGLDLADLDLAASRSFELGDWLQSKHNLDLTLGANLPVSEDEQYEGIPAVPYLSLELTSKLPGNRVQLRNSVTGDYVINTYNYSPSSGQINPDASVGYTLGGSLLIASGFRFGASASARITHHRDSSVSSVFSNQQSLSWSNKTLTVKLAHSNGTSPEDRETDLWFFDQVRRVVSFSATVRF